MKTLLDTHLLIWAASDPDKLSKAAYQWLADSRNELYFSPASLWEIAIKNGLGRSDFQIDVRIFRRALLDNGYLELPITSEHTVAIDLLPPVHKDPFDRVLLAQAMVEGFVFMTADKTLGQYTGATLV